MLLENVKRHFLFYLTQGQHNNGFGIIGLADEWMETDSRFGKLQQFANDALYGKEVNMLRNGYEYFQINYSLICTHG